MNSIRNCGLLVAGLSLALLTPSPLFAQAYGSMTRLTFGADFITSQPKEGFAANIGNGYGVNGTAVYHLLRSGLVSLRMDASNVSYGAEEKRIPLSTTAARIQLDATTTNSITALTWGPEIARPSGRIRPYVHAGCSRLFFRTSTSVKGVDSDETFASTTNQSDGVGAWAYGGGLRFQLGGKDLALMLDTGVTYHRGGMASYLREGSIHDNADGTLSISPLTSRTPYIAYTVGVKFRIPFDSPRPCSRFLC